MNTTDAPHKGVDLYRMKQELESLRAKQSEPARLDAEIKRLEAETREADKHALQDEYAVRWNDACVQMDTKNTAVRESWASVLAVFNVGTVLADREISAVYAAEAEALAWHLYADNLRAGYLDNCQRLGIPDSSRFRFGGRTLAAALTVYGLFGEYVAAGVGIEQQRRNGLAYIYFGTMPAWEGVFARYSYAVYARAHP